MKNGYIFEDTFNGHEISRHRFERSAVKAAEKWKRAFRRNNSAGSYLPTQLVRIQDGQRVARLDWEYDQFSGRAYVSEVDLGDINGDYADL